MKISIIEDNNLDEDELIIKVKTKSLEAYQIKELIENELNQKKNLVFYNDTTSFVININDILFFETELNQVFAHTNNNSYKTNYKLYELEKILPSNFTRASKSTIVNTNHIYSIERNITSSSKIQFIDSHKIVYISRFYYKQVKHDILERSF